MAAMWIFCVCCVCLVVLGIRVGRRRKKREEAELVNRLKDTCETYQLSCPYCDCVSCSRVKWGEKPETYTCINCGRSFTQEERENLLENDRELADSYFHGLTLKEAILERVKKGEGHITFQENGVVTWYQNGVGEAAAPVGQLYGLETKQGRLQVARLCMGYCQARTPEYNYWLMDSGFAWERVYEGRMILRTWAVGGGKVLDAPPQGGAKIVLFQLAADAAPAGKPAPGHGSGLLS